MLLILLCFARLEVNLVHCHALPSRLRVKALRQPLIAWACVCMRVASSRAVRKVIHSDYVRFRHGNDELHHVGVR
jgi:hypothetical protein